MRLLDGTARSGSSCRRTSTRTTRIARSTTTLMPFIEARIELRRKWVEGAGARAQKKRSIIFRCVRTMTYSRAPGLPQPVRPSGCRGRSWWAPVPAERSCGCGARRGGTRCLYSSKKARLPSDVEPQPVSHRVAPTALPRRRRHDHHGPTPDPLCRGAMRRRKHARQRRDDLASPRTRA